MQNLENESESDEEYKEATENLSMHLNSEMPSNLKRSDISGSQNQGEENNEELLFGDRIIETPVRE